MQHSQRLSHVDTHLVTRDQLRLVPVPEPTRTWQPIPHIELIESLEQVLHQNQIAIQGEEFALRRDGSTLFGVLQLVYENTDPAIPSSAVIINPPGSLPGMMSLANAPITRPISATHTQCNIRFLLVPRRGRVYTLPEPWRNFGIYSPATARCSDQESDTNRKGASTRLFYPKFRRIRDPHLTPNPRPMHAQFESLLHVAPANPQV